MVILPDKIRGDLQGGIYNDFVGGSSCYRRMFLHRWPALAYSVGTALTVGTLYVFYRKKLPWFYYFAVLFISIILLIMALTGTDI